MKCQWNYIIVGLITAMVQVSYASTTIPTTTEVQQSTSIPPQTTQNMTTRQPTTATVTKSLITTEPLTTQTATIPTTIISQTTETIQETTAQTKSPTTEKHTTEKHTTEEHTTAEVTTNEAITNPASTSRETTPVPSTSVKEITTQTTSRETTTATTPGVGEGRSTSASQATSKGVSVVMATTTTLEPISTTVCPPGYFGHSCNYACHCKDPQEVCDLYTGYCAVSGCLDGWEGPGCLLERRPGTPAIVIVLALLLTGFMLYALFMCIYLNMVVPMKQKKQAETNENMANENYDLSQMQRQQSRNTSVKRGNEYAEISIEATTQAVANSQPAVQQQHQQQQQQQQHQAVPVQKKQPPDLLDGLHGSVPKLNETNMQVNDGDILGEGRFGEITKGYLMQGQRFIDVVYKTLKPGSTESQRAGLLAQFELYSSFPAHPNVIQFFGVCTVDDHIYAAFEYAPYGNLRNYLRKNAVPGNQRDLSPDQESILSQDRLRKFCLHVANGMAHLHKYKIIHKELSAKNILVGENMVAKVAGINIDQRHGRIPEDEMEEDLIHNKRWLPPECITSGQYSYQTDIWSYGVLVWEIMTFGGKPYAELPSADLFTRIDKGYRLSKPEDCDEQVYGLMQWCWRIDPNDRPTLLTLSEMMMEHVQSAAQTEALEAASYDNPAYSAEMTEVPIDVPAELQAAYDNTTNQR